VTAAPSQHVLVAVDFSDGASLALDRARRLAQQLGLGIRIVHVAESTPVTTTALEPGADEWLRNLGVDRGALEVRRGLPWVELCQLAAEWGSLALVVGSHGRSGYQPIELGSTAARVAIAAGCPVIVVGARVGSSPREEAGRRTPRVDQAALTNGSWPAA
jgi:nucleotide-binding universal stress UspA family protein